MTKTKVIYSDVANLIAYFSHPQSDEWIEYEGKIIIKDLGKQPVIIELKFIDGYISFSNHESNFSTQAAIRTLPQPQQKISPPLPSLPLLHAQDSW
jgi:hypothetical protein